jgi:hypothetical protein
VYYLFKYSINNDNSINILIQSGGGTGPMMPGNRFLHGANSSGAICSEKIRRENPLFL